MTKCKCGEWNNVHETGVGGQDERGVFCFHSAGECRRTDTRTLRFKVFSAAARACMRLAGPRPGPNAP